MLTAEERKEWKEEGAAEMARRKRIVCNKCVNYYKQDYMCDYVGKHHALRPCSPLHCIDKGVFEPRAKNGRIPEYTPKPKTMVVRKKYEKKGKFMKPVEQLTKSGEVIREFPSISSVMHSGFSAAEVSKICNGHGKYHHGYGWRFKDTQNQNFR